MYKFHLRHEGYADIIQVLGAVFGCAFNAFGICVSTGVFTAVCDTRPLPCLRSALCFAWPTVCKAAVEMHALKKSPHFWWEGETYLLLNIVKDLDFIYNLWFAQCQLSSDRYGANSGSKWCQISGIFWLCFCKMGRRRRIVLLMAMVEVCTTACKREYERIIHFH